MKTNITLEEIASHPRKQPELWWDDECTSVSEDGLRVIHFSRPPTKSSTNDLNISEENILTIADMFGGNSFGGSGGGSTITTYDFSSGGAGAGFIDRYGGLPKPFESMSMGEIFDWSVQHYYDERKKEHEQRAAISKRRRGLDKLSRFFW